MLVEEPRRKTGADTSLLGREEGGAVGQFRRCTTQALVDGLGAARQERRAQPRQSEQGTNVRGGLGLVDCSRKGGNVKRAVIARSRHRTLLVKSGLTRRYFPGTAVRVRFGMEGSGWYDNSISGGCDGQHHNLLD
jgi:hypothetical protein